MRPMTCGKKAGSHVCDPYNRNDDDAGMTAVVNSEQEGFFHTPPLSGAFALEFRVALVLGPHLWYHLHELEVVISVIQYDSNGYSFCAKSAETLRFRTQGALDGVGSFSRWFFREAGFPSERGER